MSVFIKEADHYILFELSSRGFPGRKLNPQDISIDVYLSEPNQVFRSPFVRIVHVADGAEA